jgi:hypothetical protein
MTDWPEIFTKIALNRAIHPYQDLATAAATQPGARGDRTLPSAAAR